MTALLAFLGMSLRTRARRILGLAAFGLIFLAAAATARLVASSPDGHLEMDMLFQLGGTTLVSALLLIGWLIGRFPIIAILVLLHGAFSEDHAHGWARLYAVRPRSMLLLYGARILLFSGVAFIMSALLMPLFDYVILGRWTGFGVMSLIMAQILTFGSITALLTMVTRADSWVALFIGIIALIWDALRRMDFMQTSPAVVREAVSALLPPQAALAQVEAAFASSQPVPWDAMGFIALYAALALVVAGIVLARREI